MKPIPNFPGYFVDENGVVYSTKRTGGNDHYVKTDGPPKPLYISRDHDGYCYVALRRDFKNHYRKVHRLVLEAFVGPRPEGMEGCHYPDSDLTNNKLSNLRWDTHAENKKDAYRDRPPLTEKECTVCKLVKPASAFYKNKVLTTGLKSECKACHTRMVKARREKRQQPQMETSNNG